MHTIGHQYIKYDSKLDIIYQPDPDADPAFKKPKTQLCRP